MKKFIPFIIAITWLSVLYGQTGHEWRHKVATSLWETTAGGQSVPFLIILTQQADVSLAKSLNNKLEKATYVFHLLRDMSYETQGALTAFLTQSNAPYESLFIVNAIKSEGSIELIEALAQREDVAQIIADPVLRYAEPIDVHPGGNRAIITWGIDTIKADEVWALGYMGQGVVVGGGDTGYEWTHPALQKQYRGYDETMDTVNHNYNWHDAIHSISPLSSDSINPCGLDVREPCDDRGHGTHTMGTMIGLDGEEQIGVAPEAEWCACRNMERGNGSPFTYLECFQWFLAPTDLNNENADPAKAPHVINNSWGCPESEGCDSSNWQILDMAINILRLSGIVVVVSAGNSGSGCGSVSDPPAIYEGSFSVGATAENDTIAGFSSRGPVIVDGSNRLKPNVSAPGVRVRSSTLGGNYGNSSGTSMAGPHVAGLVALIISANPGLAGEVDIIEDIIEQTAIPKTTDQNCGHIPGSEVPNHTYGFGRIDALAAVNAAIALIPVSTDHAENIIGANVYPNPVDNLLIIDLHKMTSEVRIEIVDMHGRLISHLKSNPEMHETIQIDFSNHPAGIYLYRILIDGKMTNGKVVKN